jgi:hypothetical protein
MHLFIKLTMILRSVGELLFSRAIIWSLLKTFWSTLCKFRISVHSLETEKGRYYNIPRENRVCLSCKAGKVEDELHLFLDCPSYTHLRQDFFEKIKSILGEVNQKVFNKLQMIALLNSNSPTLLLPCLNLYTYQCMQVFH